MSNWECVQLCPTCHCRVEEHGCQKERCGLFGMHRDIDAERGPGKCCPTCGCFYEEHGCTNRFCGVHPERQP